ncbi:MAG: hypothetical protein ACOY82_10730 [Pseudomonadota bacterium]
MNDTTTPATPRIDEIAFARSRAKDSFRIMRLALTQALQHLDDQERRFDAMNDLEDQAARLNHVMFHLISDLFPRLRLDSAADAQAALLVAAAREMKA